MRLQSFLSRSGVASRRKAAEIIKKGKVSVDGNVVREPGQSVTGEEDIKIEGRRLAKEKKCYYLFNKPKGVVTTMKDEAGRKSIADYFEDLAVRLYPVGRLDRSSEGLVLMTNDGDLANEIAHPRNHVEKKYRVRLNERLDVKQRLRLERGVVLDGRRTAPCKIYPDSQKYPIYEFILKEGRNRQIRRMVRTAGLRVKELIRTEMGGVKLGRLKSGQRRLLKPFELDLLVNGPKPKRKAERS